MIRRFSGVTCSTVATAALVLIASAGIAPRAQAQTGRTRTVVQPEPDYWVGLSVGYVEGTTMTDNATGSTWQFGYTSQIRATLEKTLQRGTTIGVSAGFANVPLSYSSGDVNPYDGYGSYDAKADITQYMVFVHGDAFGGYSGFHGLYNLEAGVTQYSNFRDQATDAQLPPATGSYDATFGLGGGVGYTLSPTADLYVSDVVDFVLHSQIAGSISQSAPRFFNLRAGFRVGF